MTPRVSRTTRPEHRIRLDRMGGGPLHQQIHDQLRDAIHSGALKPGDLIENEIDLSAKLGVSRPTLQKAIAELAKGGFVTRTPGRGTIVLPRTIPRTVNIGSLHDDLKAAGRQPTTRLLLVEERPAPELLRERLGAGTGTLTYVERMRTADGEPLAILRNWLPAELVRFDPAELGEHGLYELMRREQIVPHLVEQRMGCRRATEAEAELLFDEPGDPLLTVQRLVFDDQGRFIEYGDHCYRAERYYFETVLVGEEATGREAAVRGAAKGRAR